MSLKFAAVGNLMALSAANGRWGTEAFQPAEVRAPGPLASLPLMPEWYLVIFGLAILAAS